MFVYLEERAEGPLDYPITDEEFEAAVNKVKANKSPGIDNILNEVKQSDTSVIFDFGSIILFVNRHNEAKTPKSRVFASI